MTIDLPDLRDADERLRRVGRVLQSERGRRPERRLAGRRRVAAAAVPALLTAATATAVLLSASSPSPAIAVTRDGGWLELRIEDATASPQELTRALRDAGVPGEVRTIAVPDDLVGTWAVIAEKAGAGTDPAPADGRSPGPAETVRLDRVRYSRETLRIPVDQVRESTGTFVFYAGRPARAGEPYGFDGRRFGEDARP